MEVNVERELRLVLFLFLMLECAGLFFGDYGPSFHSDHHDQSGYGGNPFAPYVYKKDVLEHLPYKGYGLKTIHKHQINTSALCELKGGVCAPPIECFGQQQFFCGNYTTTCCFNNTKHVKFSRKLLRKDIINQTALCIAKGGICAGAGQCFGLQKFNCEDVSMNCCYNNSHSTVIYKKIIYQPIRKRPTRNKYGSKRRRRPRKKVRRRFFPSPFPVFRPKKRKVEDLLFSHLVH